MKRNSDRAARAWGVSVELNVDLGEGVKVAMELIPPGEFLMGSAGRGEDSGPQHRVRITRPFYIGKYEVTNAQWWMVMKTNPSEFKGETNPAERISWYAANAFLATAGRGLRLPTEAEWEYACRAGSAGSYCFGSESARLGQDGWIFGNCGMKTHPVGGKKPNAWGLYDVHGNVWEWCSDYYGRHYYAQSPLADPQGPATGKTRSKRGGCWLCAPGYCATSYRAWDIPAHNLNLYGFRLARNLHAPAPAPEPR